MDRKDKNFRLVAVLAVLLVISLGYIAWDTYEENRAGELNEAYLIGYNAGFEAAVLTLFDQTSSCLPAEIYAGNTSRTLFDLNCLNQSN